MTSATIYVIDLESGNMDILGRYIDTIEDSIRYQRPDGTIRFAPVDYVDLVQVVPNHYPDDVS